MQTYKEVVAKFKEKNSKTPKTTWRYESWGDSYEQGGRVGYQSGQLVDHGPGRQGYSGEANITTRANGTYRLVLSKGGKKLIDETSSDLDKLIKIRNKIAKDNNIRLVSETGDLKTKIKTFVKNKVANNEYVSRPIILKEFKLSGPSGKNIITRALGNKVPGKEIHKGGLLDKLGKEELKAKSILTAAEATKKTLAESDEVLKAINKEFIFNPDISDAKEMAKNIYGSDFKKANLLQKEALVRQTDNDIMKYLKVLEGTREAPKGMKLPPQNKINDLVDNILTQLEDPTTGTKKGFKFSQGTLRNYKYSIVDALLNTKKGTFETRRKKLVEGAGKELDEIFSLGATHRMAPGYAEAVQTIPIKANRAKKELDLKMQRLLSALNEGKTTMQWNNIKNVPIKKAIKDFNKSSLKFANQYKVKAPKINISGTLSKDFLANFGPESKKNIQDVFKNKNYFLSEVKNRSVDTLTSQLKNLDIPYQGPGLSSFGAAGLDDLLKTVPAAKVGKFIKGIGLEFEPLFEGGFYEYFRRKGYTHDQAREETFFYKLANPDRTGIMEGADPLLEKDLYQIKDEEGKITGERKTVKRYIDALKERDRINKILRKKEGASDADTYAATTAEAQDLARSGAYDRVKKILQPSSAESVAYNAAVEKQQTEQGVRGIEYGEYGQGDTERLAARREKERYRLMNKKFPSYTGPQIDQRLEQYGYYINPDNRYRPKAKSLKLIEGVGYDAISDYFKNQDKTAYFAENFREEKAGGGRIGFKAGGFDKGRRAFMKWLAGITGATIAGGTGLIKLGKGAKTVAPQVTEEVIKRNAEGMPAYIYDLINVVKAKGVKRMVDNNINKYPDTVHTYKGVELTEDATGNIKIQSGDGYTHKNHMQIDKGEIGVKDEGLETQKSFQAPDEYVEGSVRPDMDGKLKDFEEGLDADVHKQFKEIADEGTYDTSLPDIDDID